MSATAFRDPIADAVDHCGGQPVEVQCMCCGELLLLACEIVDDEHALELYVDAPGLPQRVLDCPGCLEPITADLVEHRTAQGAGAR